MDPLRATNERMVPIRRRNEHAIDDTADNLQDMRYEKQYRQACKVSVVSDEFDLNQINYVENNNVFTLTHPLTNKIIRYTIKTCKVYSNGKWVNNIYIDDIIEWYKASIKSSAGFERRWAAN